MSVELLGREGEWGAPGIKGELGSTWDQGRAGEHLGSRETLGSTWDQRRAWGTSESPKFIGRKSSSTVRSVTTKILPPCAGGLLCSGVVLLYLWGLMSGAYHLYNLRSCRLISGNLSCGHIENMGRILLRELCVQLEGRWSSTWQGWDP